MATNKTIDPTNVTVQIPAMADKPNQATNSNCIDKAIDGINALNSKFGNGRIYSDESNKETYTFTLAPFSEGKYKGGLLIQKDAWNPSIYMVSMRGGNTPTDVFAYPVFTRAGSLTINSISVTNKVLSITYSDTAYGGCTLLWFN